jgi:O-antigen ligase
MSLREGRTPSWLAAWCGWVLAGMFALTPLIGWLAPLGFAPLVALAGLLTLPAIHLRRDDWSTAAALLVLVGWAMLSVRWSPYEPPDLEGHTALKLALQAPLYWAVVCAARRAAPAARYRALQMLVWGMSALGIILCLEALSGAKLYQFLKTLIGDAEADRWDLAQRNVGNGGFVLALLWGPAGLAALRVGGPSWLAGFLLGALALLTFSFGPDAPLLAALAGVAAALAVIRWPKGAARLLAVASGLFMLMAPWLILAARDGGLLAKAQAAAPQSWADRIGYWGNAANWAAADPILGWGLDASRMFSPGIRLHPHDAALQVWMELGLVGALAAAIVWGMTFARIARPRSGLIAGAQAAAAMAYFVIGAVSFGVWQEWWLALGALAAAACAAVQRQPAAVALAAQRDRSRGGTSAGAWEAGVARFADREPGSTGRGQVE